MARFLLLAAGMFLSACIGGGKPITDFADRSVVYGWLDASEIQGNHLFSANIRQFDPPTDAPFLGMGIEKHEGGYLIYHYGAPRGMHELDQISLQSCLVIICGNTINQYSFSAYADSPGRVDTRRPGVHFIGAYKLVKVRTGLFKQGEFRVTKIRGPSKNGMLAVLLKDTPEGHPVIDQRIQAAMR